MYCTTCQKHVSDCECPDIEQRLHELSKSRCMSLAAMQNILERAAKKEAVTTEDN